MLVALVAIKRQSTKEIFWVEAFGSFSKPAPTKIITKKLNANNASGRIFEIRMPNVFLETSMKNIAKMMSYTNSGLVRKRYKMP